MASQRSGAGSTRSAVAAALGVLAVLAVLTSATAAGVSYRGGDEPAAGPTSPAPSTASPSGGEDEEDEAQERFFPDGQVLTGDRVENANIELPSVDEGWTFASGGSVTFVAKGGQGSLGVADPYVYRVGFCDRPSGSDLARASIGFDRDGPIPGDDPEDALRDRTDLWLMLLFEDYGDEPPEVEYSDISLSDGTPAHVSRFDFPPRDDSAGPCGAPALELRTLTFDSGSDEFPAVYLFREVAADGGDLPDGLSSADADALLAATRIQQED